MEVSQRNSLCNYLKEIKTSFFFFFPYTKTREQVGGTYSYWGLVPERRARSWGKSEEG
jgi:hypothetical protein